MSRLTRLCGAALFAAVGCGEGAQTSSSDNTGVMVHSLALQSSGLYSGAGQHRLEFWEFAGGTLGVKEVGTLDAPRLLDSLDERVMTFAEIFRAAAPEVADVPQALLDADARWQQPDAHSSVQYAPLQPSAAQLASTLAECGFDAFEDNFSAQQFLDNFCRDGDDRSCETNRPSVWVDKSSDWFSWTVMAAEHQFDAHTNLSYVEYDCNQTDIDCRPVSHRLVDEHIAARDIVTWRMRNYGWRNWSAWAGGADDCPRVHTVARWSVP